MYNIVGDIILRSNRELKAPGTYFITWDGKSNSGELVPSGVYHIKLIAGSKVFHQNITLIK
ncbi:MAG: FlgD immunoglobulin-like domain containing protein [Bacteroidales bacterium]